MNIQGSDWKRGIELTAVLITLVGLLPSQALAADHGDTPILINANRRDALLTDLFVFLRGENLVIAVCMNPAIPPSANSYTFAPDLVVRINIDGLSEVTSDNESDLEIYGGTLVDPGHVSANVTFKFTFEDPAGPTLKLRGVRRPDMSQVQIFSGLRDDPFIRAPREGRNVAALVVELPLYMIPRAGDTLLVWATSQVPALDGPFQDAAARSIRSMFPETDWMNRLHPHQHWMVMGVVPDVAILDVTRPVEYPNGRELLDDVVDLVNDPRVVNTDAPFPTTNDRPHLEVFPYLAEPHPPVLTVETSDPAEPETPVEAP